LGKPLFHKITHGIRAKVPNPNVLFFSACSSSSLTYSHSPKDPSSVGLHLTRDPAAYSSYSCAHQNPNGSLFTLSYPSLHSGDSHRNLAVLLTSHYVASHSLFTIRLLPLMSGSDIIAASSPLTLLTETITTPRLASCLIPRWV